MGKSCELCHEQTDLVYLHGRCHINAPLEASLEGATLTLRCIYCHRLVAQFQVIQKGKEHG